MAKNPRYRVEHMIVQCGFAQEFLEGMTYEAFYGDAKTQAACFGAVLIIGEAAAKVPESFRAQFPEIPWEKLERTRGRMIHGTTRFVGSSYGA